MSNQLELEEVASDLIEIEVVNCDTLLLQSHSEEALAPVCGDGKIQVTQAPPTAETKTLLPKITRLLALYKCNLCSFKTLQRTDMDNHKKTHNTLKSVEKYTYVPAPGRSLLKKPRKGHFKCTECTYYTKCKRSLKVHQHIHTNGKPYKCTDCSFKGRDLKELIKHYETCAKVKRRKKDLNKTPSARKCPVCDCIENCDMQLHIFEHIDMLGEFSVSGSGRG